MGLREVKSELNKLDKKTLIKHISEFYKKFKPVKEYLDFYISSDETTLLEQYKKRITAGFFPRGRHTFNLSISRKAINDFKKLGTSKESLADLLLHYVECGVELTNTYGDIDENFYASIENTYASALTIIDDNKLHKKFQTRAQEIVDDTDGIGWGFHDYLEDLYYNYYE